MSKQILIITCYLLCCASCFGQSVQERYIEQYKGIAIREMERAGIPASIKLGQGILESNSGQSELARKAKNHFGMKCGSQWNGPTHYREDDDYNENGELIKSCFRVFRSHDAGYVAHSEFLRDPRKDYRYGWLFDLNPRDYVAWAKGLKKSGYATSPTYAEKLIRIIETYDLHKYDFMAEEDLSAQVPDVGAEEEEPTSPAGSRIYSKRIFRNNDVRYVLAMAEDTPHEIGLRYGIATRKLFRFNEQVKSPNQHLEEGERVYVQCKKNNYRGKRKYHYVKEGETMYGLSQKYGVKLKKLYRKNRMQKRSEPAPGTRLKIRGRKIKDYEKAPKRNDYRPSKPPPENKQTPAPDKRNEVEFDPETEPVTPEYDPVLTNRYERKPPPKNERTTRPTRKPPSREKAERASDTAEPDRTYPTRQNQREKDRVSQSSNNTSTTINGFHTVAEGDTLYRISRLYDITVGELKKLNRLNSNIIHRGQKLRIK